MTTAAIRITGKPVSDRVRTILADVCREVGISGCRVTSAGRTPAEQAAAMYGLVARQDVAVVRALYRAPGRAVIDVYVAHKGESRAQILAAMTEKILDLGPEKVSLHCSARHEVIDVAPSSIPAPRLEAFVAAAERHPEVERVLSPISQPRDPEAVHIEIARESPPVS